MEGVENFDFMRKRFRLSYFETLDEAFIHITNLKEKMIYNGEVVVAYEYLCCGSRYFVVISYQKFLSFYLKLNPIKDLGMKY